MSMEKYEFKKMFLLDRNTNLCQVDILSSLSQYANDMNCLCKLITMKKLGISWVGVSLTNRSKKHQISLGY